MTLPYGYHDWTAGEDVTADNLEGYCMAQSVMIFASASARDAALSAIKREGMMAYLLDVNTLTIYSGSAWSTIGPVHGAGTTWTPTVTQSGSVAVTVAYAKYWRTGRLITASFVLGVTGSGTGANAVVIGGLPATAATNSPLLVVGDGLVDDTSATTTYPGQLVLATTTTLKYLTTAASSTTGAFLGAGPGQFSAGLASGDTLSGTFSYEAAADG